MISLIILVALAFWTYAKGTPEMTVTVLVGMLVVLELVLARKR